MPSRNHIVVVQDMSSRFPAAKLVSSTAADKVLPALADIYDTYGNPARQLSDNGPPFNSYKMQKFAEERNIQLDKIPPLHPSANPVETFMKPLGKTMKIAHYNKDSERKALQNLLENYRDTPHPATGVPPSAMLFRDSMSGSFPRKSVTEDMIQTARHHDAKQKLEYQNKMTSSKYKKLSDVSVGDQVLVRNYQKRSKFEPLFLPDPFVITAIRDQGRKLELEKIDDGKVLYRHLDDIKKSVIPNIYPEVSKENISDHWNNQWNILSEYSSDYDNNASYQCEPNHVQPGLMEGAVGGDLQPGAEDQVRRSGRQTGRPNYYGVEEYNENHPLRGEDLVIDPWWPNYPRRRIQTE